jgi:hypothetical protein
MSGTMYNGIAVQLADNVTIEDNLVEGYRDMTSWIYLTKVTNSTLKHNKATQYKVDGSNEKLENKSNATISQAKVGDTSTMETWLSKRGPKPDNR